MASAPTEWSVLRRRITAGATASNSVRSGTISSAVCLTAMEHYKSTLATAAVAAFGLLAAAHILHPGNYQDLPRQVRASAVNAEAPSSTMSWVDPPERTGAVSAISSAVITSAQAAEARSASAPASIAPEPAASKQVAQEAQVSTEPMRKSEALRRQKVAQRRARVHQAALVRKTPSAPAASELTPVPIEKPKSADRFDPIGNLIHGLGLDS